MSKTRRTIPHWCTLAKLEELIAFACDPNVLGVHKTWRRRAHHRSFFGWDRHDNVMRHPNDNFDEVWGHTKPWWKRYGHKAERRRERMEIKAQELESQLADEEYAFIESRLGEEPEDWGYNYAEDYNDYDYDDEPCDCADCRGDDPDPEPYDDFYDYDYED